MKESNEKEMTENEISVETSLQRRSLRQFVLLSIGLLLLVWGSSFALESMKFLRNHAPPGSAIPPGGRFAHALSTRDWKEFAALAADFTRHCLTSPAFIAKSCPISIVGVFAIVAAFYGLLRIPAARRLEQIVIRGVAGTDCQTPAAESSWRQSCTWVIAGLLVIAAALAILEHSQAYYFVQSDVYQTEFPSILQGCRTIAAGQFPEWNPCLIMGTPTASAGMYSLLYPPMYLSYAIARWGLRDEYATMDIFAAMHFLAGYLATFAAARAMRIRPSLAFAVGISFVLTNYFLFQGRSTHATIPNLLWPPILVWAAQRWMDGRADRRWLLATSVSIAAYYYAGFPMFWVYGQLLVVAAAAIALFCRRLDWRQLLWPLAAELLALAMILPLVVVQLDITKGMAIKSIYGGWSMLAGIWAALFPYPLAPLDDSLSYYAGTLLIGCFYLSFGALLAYRWSRNWLGRNPWMLVSLLAMWIGLGQLGGLWSLLGMLPVLRTINHAPHRLFPFFALFGLLAGGKFLERVLDDTFSRRWQRCVAGLVAVLMLYQAVLSRDALFCFADRLYPPMKEAMAERLLPADPQTASRVWYAGPSFSRLPGYAGGLPVSIAAAYGVYSFNGYDPIADFRPETMFARKKMREDPVQACRAYGIRWILSPNPDYYGAEIPEMEALCPVFIDQGIQAQRDAIAKSATLVLRQKETLLYELADVSPLAFDEAQPKTALPIRFLGRGADIDVPGTGRRTIIINVLTRPWLFAYGNGRRLSAEPDDWGRLRVVVPDGVERVELRCLMGWWRGIVLGAGLAAATLAGCVLLRKWVA